MLHHGWRCDFHVYTNTGTITYFALSQAESANLSFDLAAFIQHAVSMGYLQDAWYLTTVLGGFEVYSRGTDLAVTDFHATVN